MRRIMVGLLLAAALVVSTSGTAWAQASGSCTVRQTQDERRSAARAAFVRGQELFEANEYQTALVSFECSFQNVPHPSTLYNVARAAELSGEFSRALDAWRGYLQMSPDAEDRAEIEQRIAGLEQALAAQQQANSADANMSGQVQQPIQSWTPTGTSTNVTEAPANWETPANAPTDVYQGNLQSGQEYQAVEVVPPSPWRQYAWYIFGGGAAVALIGVFMATPLLNLATADASDGSDGACYDAEADLAGDYYISSSCWISGAVLAGLGGAAMIASILIWALAERGGQRVVTRTASRFVPQLALGPRGGSLTMSF